MKTSCAIMMFAFVAVASAAARAQDSTETLTASMPPPPAPRRVSRFGLGVRIGYEQMSLTPPAGLAAQINQGGAAENVTAGDFAFNASALSVTPTMQIGGAGYFFKLDLPVRFASNLTMIGLGLYPLNFGYFVARARFMPYASLGGVASVVRSGDTGNADTAHKIVGAVVQTRIAAGAMYFPVRGLAFSAELGFSPWAAGIVTDMGPATGGGSVRGGEGTMFDVSLGAAWL
jgi:hypothetical protein